jgi:hypothetical protein
VTRVADAASRIIDDLRLDGPGTRQPVTSLAVWRRLQHARAGISTPRGPSSPPGGAQATRAGDKASGGVPAPGLAAPGCPGGRRGGAERHRAAG